MIEQRAIVRSLKPPFAEVETQRQSSCGSCQARQGCGTATIARFFPRRAHLLLALNEVDAKPGDEVVLCLDDDALRNASLVVYLVPLIGLILGTMAGEWLDGWLALQFGELTALLGGLFGILAGFSWVRYYGQRHRTNPKFQPVILRIQGFGVDALKVSAISFTGGRTDVSE